MSIKGIIFLGKYDGDILQNKKVILDQNLNLGAILVHLAKTLKGVCIKGNKILIERKIDRLVFKVDNSAIATGEYAEDALKVTSKVKMQNDKFLLIGKSTMRVMINDKIIGLAGDDLLNYLTTIPSDNSKSLEVITNYPAKYEE